MAKTVILAIVVAVLVAAFIWRPWSAGRTPSPAASVIQPGAQASGGASTQQQPITPTNSGGQ